MEIENRNFGQMLAFTLAEVLIVIGILGIIAEITIPTLIKNYTRQVYLTQLKKTYTTLDEGFKTMAMNDGSTDFADTDFYKNFDTSLHAYPDFGALDAILKKTFRIVYSCQDGATNTKCADFNPIYGDLVGPSLFGANEGHGLDFLLNDGTLVYAYNCSLDSTCGLAGSGINLVVDVNGPNKKPNKYGRDVFRLRYANNKLEAWYIDNPQSEWNTGGDGCPCNTSEEIDAGGMGWDCAQRIVQEGWQMNY